MTNPLYVDNNATTPLPREVFEAMVPFLTENYFNPSSPSFNANQVASAVLSARESIAEYFGMLDSKELVFTSGATESNNWAVFGAAKANPEKRHIITTQVEHPSIKEVCLDFSKRGYEITWLPVDRNGLVGLNELEEALRVDTLLVTIMHGNNETGVIFPIQELAKVVKENFPETLFHTDASQTAGKIPIDLGDDWAAVDLLSFTGHKLHGPKGIGGLFVRRGIKFEPMILGGHHENGMRAGTENVPYIIGLAEAIRLTNQSTDCSRELRDRLEMLIESQLTGVIPVGKKSPRLDNTLCIAIENIDSETMLSLLEQDGILASNGAACSSGTSESSSVLKAMGISHKAANGAIRFSFSRYNAPTDADKIFASLKKAFRLFC